MNKKLGKNLECLLQNTLRSLVCKIIKLEHILKVGMTIVNFVLARKLGNYQFTSFILDINSEYEIFHVTM
jgi:hypothetical protein